MQQWTLPQIKKALEELNKKGWIKSKRKHDTGIGKTLEEELGIPENNIALPDFGIMELKSQRINTQSMMTLFTKKPEGTTNTEIRKRFGYRDKEFPKVKCLRQTIIGQQKNALGFQCEIDRKSDRMIIKKDEVEIGYYPLSFLEAKAIKKIGDGLILVLADSKKIKGQEYFYFKEAYLLQDIEPKKFIKYLKYDIRLGVHRTGTQKGLSHDHGSAFRLPQNSISNLFNKREKLL